MDEAFSQVARLRPYQIWPGTTARAVHGERLTMAVVDVGPNCAVPEHRHEHEQVGVVIRGQLTMDVDGTRSELGVGHTYCIRSGLPHLVIAGPDGATVVDIFAPVRSDWDGLVRPAVTPGQWP
jgi:quercetin dioxygenase-like cupin family protein